MPPRWGSMDCPVNNTTKISPLRGLMQACKAGILVDINIYPGTKAPEGRHFYYKLVSFCILLNDIGLKYWVNESAFAIGLDNDLHSNRPMLT